MMKDYFDLTQIEKNTQKGEMLRGAFGIEREGLRVNGDGTLALTPHPAAFGNKLTNPLITTDFSESQIEIVTPALESVEATYGMLSFLTDLVNETLQHRDHSEYFWPNSMPCMLPAEDKIPIAHYEGALDAEASMAYRRGLAEKYGTQKQVLSGIHFNYSLDEAVLKKLYQAAKADDYTGGYQDFKDAMYLKIARNYLRYRWLVIYLSGATTAAHKTFEPECLALMPNEDGHGSRYSGVGPSFRNGTTGYKNLLPLYPRYDTAKHFADDVSAYVKDGKLSQAKEYYAQVRLKPAHPKDWLHSLATEGITYVELRTMDLNPYDKCGIGLIDMQFMHSFILFCLMTGEEDWQAMPFDKTQAEGVHNENIVAERGFTNPTLRRHGQDVTLTDWASAILKVMRLQDELLGLGRAEMLDTMQARIDNPNNTYARRLFSEVRDAGFIKSMLSQAATHTIESDVNQKLNHYDWHFAKYKDEALPGRK